MNWEPSMDPYELRESIGENLEETCQHGDKAFPCAGYRDHYRRGREGYPWHWHDEWEIAFVEQGQVRAQVNGEQHLLGPGEGIFINRRVLHSFSLEGDGEVWMPNLLFLPSLLYGSQESVFWEKYAKPLAFSTGCTHLALRQDVPWQREALAQAGLCARHEVRLAPRCRIDFMVDGVGVEIKKNRPNASLLARQLARYAACEEVEQLLVLAPRGVNLPRTIGGKRVTMMGLERLWGIGLP